MRRDRIFENGQKSLGFSNKLGGGGLMNICYSAFWNVYNVQTRAVPLWFLKGGILTPYVSVFCYAIDYLPSDYWPLRSILPGLV
jgi:hypothetical protein